MFLNVAYGKEANRIVGVSDDLLNIELTCAFSLHFIILIDPYVEEGRANALLIHFLSTLLNIPNISCSLMYKDSKLAMKIEDIDYEDVFVKLQTVMLK